MSKTLGSLTVGAKIEVPVLSAYQSRFGSKIVFKIADKNHSGYPSNSVTLITEKIIQNMASDAKEPSNSNNDRKNYGNNRLSIFKPSAMAEQQRNGGRMVQRKAQRGSSADDEEHARNV